MLFELSWRYLRQRSGILTVVILCQFAQVLANLQLPSLNARIINEGVVGADPTVAWRLGGQMLAVSVVGALLNFVAVYYAASLAMGLGKYLRREVFRAVSEFSSLELNKFGAATLVTRATNDVQQIQMVAFMTLSMIISAPVMMVGGLIMAISEDAPLSLIFAVCVPVLAALLGLIIWQLSPLFRSQQEKLDRVNAVLREQLQGVRVIRAFVRQLLEKQRFARANDDLQRVALRIGWVFAFFFPALSFVVGASAVAVIWFGSLRINGGHMQVGSLLAYISYLMMILMSVLIASMLFMFIPRARVTAKRVAEVVDTVPQIRPLPGAVDLPDAPVTFSFEDVQVTFPGAERPVLTGINATFSPGKTVAVIGSTGSGKSTFVNLLPRLLDPTSGRVCAQAGGQKWDLRDVSLAQVRQRIALVPQKAYLFSGTIATTVAGVDSHQVTAQVRTRVLAALQTAGALDFVMELAEGIDAKVEAGGTNFSGGQRQRLTIARALYKDADLLVFDDSFSALDYTTDAKVRQNLRQSASAAVLIVAQRISTVRGADEIIVLDGGQIVGRGTHNKLLDNCGTYAEIVTSQLSAEEAK
ncbi:MAG: ABC transporter ATP-binding protein [Actinomycetaceae bacterium]|nr:ABC transporter ATP-binding protein [Actinomycetaceae bacterium]